MSKRKGRPIISNKQSVSKYKQAFITYITENHGVCEAESHYEDSDVPGFSDNERYTDEFLKESKQKLQISFGNTKVEKYKQEFLEYLKNMFKNNDRYLDYIENKNMPQINNVFPGESRYSGDYFKHRSKNTTNVKKFRKKLADNETQTFNEIICNLNDLLDKKKDELVNRKVFIKNFKKKY